MWSFGIAILEAGDGAIPRGNLSERAVLSEITRQPPPRFTKRKPSGDLQSLVNALLNKDASVRPTAAQCLQVPWFMAACTREELKAYFDTQLAPAPAPTALAASSSGDEMDVLSRKKLSGRFDNWISKAKERRDKTEARAVSPNRRDSPRTLHISGSKLTPCRRARAFTADPCARSYACFHAHTSLTQHSSIPISSERMITAICSSRRQHWIKRWTSSSHSHVRFVIACYASCPYFALTEELTFLSTFFITHRSFTSSEKVLAAFRQRCVTRPHYVFFKTHTFHLMCVSRFEAEAGKEGMQNRIRICILLKHWVANHWDDFDEQFLAQFIDVIKTVVQPVIASSANIVLQLIEKKVRTGVQVCVCACTVSVLRVVCD